MKATWCGAGARVVAKAYPEEKVGVFARRGAHVEVVEYSEMDPEEAASVDPGTPPSPNSRPVLPSTPVMAVTMRLRDIKRSCCAVHMCIRAVAVEEVACLLLPLQEESAAC